MVNSDETQTIANRPARMFDVKVSPDSVDDWLPAIRTTRFYLFTIEGSEPLLIRASATARAPVDRGSRSSIIASLVLGPDAPPMP